MRIAVTGASGFIGGCLARSLARAGHHVLSYGRRPAAALRWLLPHYQQWNLPDALANVPDVDAVVHCAALTGDWGPEADYRRANVEGTRAVLAAFSRGERIVHVSTASVYSADVPGDRLTEDAAVGHGLYSAYARSKADAETLLFNTGRPVVILRPQIVYGPGDTTLFPRLVAARRWGWIAVPGNGRNRVSVTHIANFAHAVQCVLLSDVMQGVFNIADAQDPSVDELLRTLLALHGIPARLFYVPLPLAYAAAGVTEKIWRLTGQSNPPRLTRYVVSRLGSERTLDLERARTLLGYTGRYSFRDCLQPPEGWG